MTKQPEPLVRMEHLSKHFIQHRPWTNSNFTVQAFEDVSLAIHRGTTLALVGESGAGKSTFARCLALLEAPVQGEIWLEGVNLLSLAQKELLPFRRKIQMIFQDSTSALNPRLTAAEIVSEPLLIQREGTKAQRRERTLALMEQVGLLPEWEQKSALEFSGGQRQRLAIARALSLEPELLVLDEALSNLDIVNQDMILKLLSDLQSAHSLAYLHISHDLRLVSRFADEVAVMYEGKIVERSRAAKLFAQPEHHYTQELLAAMPSLESICEERFA
ncbi:MAG: ATP-binding cassette domain-containing protein [Candidatus Acidiferrales bacterium]